MWVPVHKQGRLACRKSLRRKGAQVGWHRGFVGSWVDPSGRPTLRDTAQAWRVGYPLAPAGGAAQALIQFLGLVCGVQAVVSDLLTGTERKGRA